MMVSELCANGDLFDYVRNVPAPSLYKAVRLRYRWVFFSDCPISLVEHNARRRTWFGISSYPEAVCYSQGLQVLEHSNYFPWHCKDCRFWARQGQTVNALDGSEFSWHRQLASP